MPYPRRLGQSIDCTDPNNYDDAECIGSPIPGFTPQQTTTQIAPTTSNSPGFLETLLTDVVQIFKQGTPVTQKVYTPGTTAAGQILTNPLVLLALGAVALSLAGKRR